LEEGWGKAVSAVIEALLPDGDGARTLRQVNVLPGSHLSPADVEEVRDIVESFGLSAVVLPDLSGSLDGHVPDGHVPTSLGGTPVATIATMGRSMVTLAIGEQMRPAAEALARTCGVPYRLFDHLTGLAPTDAFVAALMEAGGAAPPARLKRERSRLVDAMLDGHFSFDGRRVCVAAEADLLLALTSFLAGMGAVVHAAVAPVATPAAASVPATRVLIGDLDDLEQASGGCDLLVANSHAREAAARLGVPLYRIGFPVFDRLGGPQRVSVGYRGSRQLIFDLANLFLDYGAHAHAGVEEAPTGFRKDHRHAQAQVG
jgi:nitrogenase molybdenum-iron protein NifN